jgi:hypothetical protein
MMTGTDPATLAQLKLLAQQAADIALTEQAGTLATMQRNIELLAARIAPDDGEKAIPGVLKWLAGIAAGVISAIILGALFWVASSVTDMQQTLARIDERQKAQTESLDSRFADYDRRITRLEKFHSLEGGG